MTGILNNNKQKMSYEYTNYRVLQKHTSFSNLTYNFLFKILRRKKGRIYIKTGFINTNLILMPFS